MNKSKFLKKSLAMLLALMLVFAMIPLSASAAEGESVYFKDLYVDGQRAAVNGDQLSSDVVETTTVDLTVGTLNGAELYVDVKNTENDKPFPCYNLDLTDETVATKTGENKYQVGILVKVKDNPESDDAKIVESYTLTITVEEIKEGDDVLLRGLAAGETTWANLVSYEVIHPEDNGGDTGLVNITLKFGYDEPTDLVTTDFDAIDPDSEIVIVDDETVAVESQLGSRSTYKLAYTWQAAFESFEIPGQDGETEFVWEGSQGNKINIKVPYAYDFDADIIPTFEFANDVTWVKGNTDPDRLYSNYTVLNKLNGWSNTAATGVLWDNVGTIQLSTQRADGTWAKINVTITGVAKNAEGDLKTIQITDQDTPANKSNTTDAQVGTFEVEMPKGTPIKSNTFDLVMTASKDATVKVIDQGNTPVNVTKDTTDVDSKTSKYTATITTGDDKDTYSFTVQVTPEAGGATKNYNVNMTTPEIAQAQLKSVVLKDTVTGDTYTAEIDQNKKEVRLMVPYAWSNPANTTNVELFLKASTGATILDNDYDPENGTTTGHTWGFEGSAPLAATGSWLPTIDDVEHPTTITVLDSENPDVDANSYKVYVETLPAKTERKISDITFVGTDKPYEITPSNTYETTLGTAKLADGTEVRTIEVTVPYSYTNEDAYISDWTISEGAVAYGGWGTVTAFKPLGDNSETNKYPWAFELDKYIDGKGDNGTLQEGKYLKIYVLSEEYAVPERNTDGRDIIDNPADYKDKVNASIYYLVAKRAPAETGHEMLSIESTVDKNVTATLEGTTITINVPYTYQQKPTTAPSPFSLNFELSKLAKLYADNDFTNEAAIITSDNGSAQTTGRTLFRFSTDDPTKFLYQKADGVWGTLGDKVYVYSESGNQSQAYDVKVNVNKPETGASITALSVNGTAGTITQDKINVRLPLGSKLYPVTLDIEASKMAKVEIGGKAYNPENKYDVNDEVKITVTSENGEVVNNYYLNVTVSDSFNDVSSSEWYYDEVMTAANAGWINGTKPGYFEPNGTMTRADFMVIIARILDCDTEATVESLFPDCNETDYFNAAVTFCKQRGIIDGDDKGYFNPYDAITREEMAKILCNALELDELETSANPFDDDAEIAQWAKGYVNAVQAEGIMEGSNGSFNPRDNATRAEGAAVLVRAFA